MLKGKVSIKILAKFVFALYNKLYEACKMKENAIQRTEKIAKQIIAMPHFGTYGGFDFYIQSKCLYEKAHVHVQKDGKKSKFWLEPELELAKTQKQSPTLNLNELKKCIDIIEDHREEFLSKFKNEQKKNNISTKTQRKTTRRKSALEVKDYSLDKKTLLVLPVIKGLLSKINSSWIERTICDEESCIVFFKPNKENIKPWLEICLFNGKQHIDFEIVTASDGDEKFLDYETFVTKQNENKVLNKIWFEINKLYSLG